MCTAIHEVCYERIREQPASMQIFSFLDENRIISYSVTNICVVLFHAGIHVTWHSTKPAGQRGLAGGKQ